MDPGLGQPLFERMAPVIRRSKVLLRAGRINLSVLGPLGLARVVGGLLLGRRHPLLAIPPRADGIWLRAGTCDVPLYKQIFLRREYDVDYPFEPRTIIDAGANIGLAARWFAERFPKARIIALEPVAENFELLKKNLAGTPSAVPMHKALWHERKELVLKDWGTSYVGFSAMESPAEGVERGDVAAGVTVRDLVEEYGLEPPILLKLDIEGGEKALFDRPGGWVDLVDGIAVELHERKSPGCTRSFYRATEGFPLEARFGENVFCFRRPAAG
jgi:FkbM family methyltransferase